MKTCGAMDPETGAVCSLREPPERHEDHVGHVDGSRVLWPNDAFRAPSASADADLGAIAREVRRQEAVARRGSPQTAWDAARLITSAQMTANQQEVLAALLAAGPMTDEQLVQRVVRSQATPSMSTSGCRTRRSELVELGMVYDTGERRRLATGRLGIVWAAHR